MADSRVPFRLTLRDAVALLGAHTLGRAETANSGFDGVFLTLRLFYLGITCPVMTVVSLILGPWIWPYSYIAPPQHSQSYPSAMPPHT